MSGRGGLGISNGNISKKIRGLTRSVQHLLRDRFRQDNGLIPPATEFTSIDVDHSSDEATNMPLEDPTLQLGNDANPLHESNLEGGTGNHVEDFHAFLNPEMYETDGSELDSEDERNSDEDEETGGM